MENKYLQEYKFYLIGNKQFSIYEDYDLTGEKTVDSILKEIKENDILCRISELDGNIYVPYKNVICIECKNVLKADIDKDYKTNLEIIKKN